MGPGHDQAGSLSNDRNRVFANRLSQVTHDRVALPPPAYDECSAARVRPVNGDSTQVESAMIKTQLLQALNQNGDPTISADIMAMWSSLELRADTEASTDEQCYQPPSLPGGRSGARELVADKSSGTETTHASVPSSPANEVAQSQPPTVTMKHLVTTERYLKCIATSHRSTGKPPPRYSAIASAMLQQVLVQQIMNREEKELPVPWSHPADGQNVETTKGEAHRLSSKQPPAYSKTQQDCQIYGPEKMDPCPVGSITTSKTPTDPHIPAVRDISRRAAVPWRERWEREVMARKLNQTCVNETAALEPPSSCTLRAKDLEDACTTSPSAKRQKFQEARHHALNLEWIDVKDITSWLATCAQDHGLRCAPYPSASRHALWLVDVSDECLIPASTTNYRYIALSYVWGRSVSIETRLANVSALQRPGVLAESPQATITITDAQGVDVEHEKVVVPKTIRHAMKLVRLLGERYLWVDRLCIVQDDPAEKHGQISVMADIYAGAYATIIAANGWDADHGMRGIKGVTEPRRLLSHDSMNDRSRDTEKEYLEALQPYQSVWYSRGWTFQELFFSKRRIFFQYQVAVWECCCALWHEGTGTSGDIPVFGPSGGKAQKSRSQDAGAQLRSMSPSGASAMPTSPNLNQFLRMVNFYNIRSLTFPSDGLKAFSGVLTALSPVFPGGFIWGLPMALFDAALLWLPNDPLKRRRPGPPGTAAIPNSTDEWLPSWSWVVWEGSIESRSFVHSARCSMDRRSDPGWTTDLTRFMPLCDWTLVACADALLGDASSCKIPRPNIQFDPRISVTTTWTAPSLPSHFLATEAEVHTFRLGGHYEEAYEEDIDNHCADDDFSDDTGSARAYDGSEIVDADGNFVGVMLRTFHKMHSGDDGIGDGLKGRECELMLVSSSKMRWISFLEPGEAERKWKRNGRGRDSGAEHGAEENTVAAHGLEEVVQYNVLWIRREGGIAYREGVGRVSEKTWKRFPARKERIVLG